MPSLPCAYVVSFMRSGYFSRASASKPVPLLAHHIQHGIDGLRLLGVVHLHSAHREVKVLLAELAARTSALAKPHDFASPSSARSRAFGFRRRDPSRRHQRAPHALTYIQDGVDELRALCVPLRNVHDAVSSRTESKTESRNCAVGVLLRRCSVVARSPCRG